jgi:hypothetical protein
MIKDRTNIEYDLLLLFDNALLSFILQRFYTVIISDYIFSKSQLMSIAHLNFN